MPDLIAIGYPDTTTAVQAMDEVVMKTSLSEADQAELQEALHDEQG